MSEIPNEVTTQFDLAEAHCRLFYMLHEIRAGRMGNPEQRARLALLEFNEAALRYAGLDTKAATDAMPVPVTTDVKISLPSNPMVQFSDTPNGRLCLATHALRNCLPLLWQYRKEGFWDVGTEDSNERYKRLVTTVKEAVEIVETVEEMFYNLDVKTPETLATDAETLGDKVSKTLGDAFLNANTYGTDGQRDPWCGLRSYASAKGNPMLWKAEGRDE